MSGEPVAGRRLHPGTILLRFAKEAPSTVLALPAGLAFVSDAGIGRALGWAALIAGVMLLIGALAWWRFRYRIGAEEIVIESGILSRNRRSIPFGRIQDVDLERSALARLLGLAKVRIETGAGGKDEGLLDSVSLEEARRLRETVRAWRSGHSETAGAEAEAPAAEAGRTLFEMPVGRVFLFGLFNFSLVYLAGLFALLQSFDQFLPFDVYDPARWVGLAGDYLPRFSAGAIAAALFLAGLLGIVAGVLRTLSRDYGYRLSLEGDRLRRERGLLTRSEVVIARARVQLGQVETGPVRRALGWFGLSFQTLGAGGDSSGHQSAAPFARREEVDAVLAETGGLAWPRAEAMTRVSRRHVVRALAGTVLPVAVLVVTTALWLPPALLALVLLPLLAIVAVLERRFHRYGLTGDLLFVERGVWRQRLWMLPVANIQSLSLSHGPLQRRLGLATLALDTAGAPLLNIPRIVDLREDLARSLAAEISRRRRRSAQASGRKSGTER